MALITRILGENKAAEVLGVLCKSRGREDMLVRAPLVRWADWMWHPC